MLVDFKVGVGRFVVAEGRAGRGQVKNAACSNFSKIENSIKDNRVWKIVLSDALNVVA